MGTEDLSQLLFFLQVYNMSFNSLCHWL